MMPKTCLVVVFTHLARDARVLRQIRFLSSLPNLQITTAALGPNPLPGQIRHIELIRPPQPASRRLLTALCLLARRHAHCHPGQWHTLLKGALGEQRFDLIMANDCGTLPAIHHFLGENSTTRVFLDAHEFFPLEFEESLLFRLFFQSHRTWLCRQSLPTIHAMTTVSHPLAHAYERWFGVKATVLTNAPFKENLSPTPVNPQRIRLIHHGGIMWNRKPEQLLTLVEKLDPRFTLDLMVIGDDSNRFKRFCQRVEKTPRARLIAPVKPHEVSQTLNHYDLGVHLLHDKGFNDANGLPNKLFDFIQGRLAVAIWPSPGMSAVVHQYGCGVVSDAFTIDAMARAINALSAEDIMTMKQHSHQAAQHLCAENNQRIFLEMVRELLYN